MYVMKNLETSKNQKLSKVVFNLTVFHSSVKHLVVYRRTTP
uniref:Uncharacterized protein n=1 Tax=Human betaherpesvirus 6 TaxID=10368 RepID=A0A1W6G125_9BETA|nr:hypothetical protein [Human betaherpesvirus 6]